VFDDVRSAADLRRGPGRTLDILASGPAIASDFGRVWVRGIASLGSHLLIGCSQFHDISRKTANPAPSHLRVFDRATLHYQGAIFLPMIPEAPMPVLYSILPLPAVTDGGIRF
jgi:hypothetical protein